LFYKNTVLAIKARCFKNKLIKKLKIMNLNSINVIELTAKETTKTEGGTFIGPISAGIKLALWLIS
jgi:hypothetical protein